MNTNPVTDADLHAYVDAELTVLRRAEIEARLAIDLDAAARVRAYAAQKQALRKLFDPVLDEPLPEALHALADPPRTSLSRWSLQRIAAGFAIAIVSGLLGWVAHGQYRSVELLARAVPLPHQAAVAHAVFSPDMRRPVEVSAEQEEQLVTWLSKRIGTPIRPPKLGTLGYELIGGRLLPGNSGPVAQFMYQDASGQRLTLYVSTENATNRDTAFRFAQEGPVNVFYWIDGKFGYALSAGIARDELAHVAKAVYDQIEN